MEFFLLFINLIILLILIIALIFSLIAVFYLICDIIESFWNVFVGIYDLIYQFYYRKELKIIKDKELDLERANYINTIFREDSYKYFGCRRSI